MFTCYIIGRTTLLVRCAEHIIETGNVILGIVSVDTVVKKFAEKKGIPIIPFDKFKLHLTSEPCDYLFSIFNNRLLDEQHLSSPKRYAINCHDGPLPYYGGVNAVTWALINREQQHGITWHRMVLEVDGGPILQQPIFPISPSDTTFTLRLKCWEHAQASFVELVPLLMGSDYLSLCKPQHQEGRSYFTRFKRPSSSSFIDFHTQSALQIEALVRALAFGPQDINPMGSPKVLFGNTIIIPTTASVLPPQEKNNNAVVGQIIDINTDNITIRTIDGDIRIGGLVSMFGTKLTVAGISSTEHAFVAGSIIQPIHSPQLSEVGEVSAKQEEFWVRRFEKLRVPAMFQQRTEPHAPHKKVPLDDITPLRDLQSDSSEFAVVGIAAFAYLLQVFGRDDAACDIGSQYSGNLTSQGSHFLEHYLPFHIDFISPTQTVAGLLASIKKELSTISEKGPCQADVFRRYPSLISKGEHHRTLFAVTLQHHEVSTQEDDPNAGVDLVFHCNKDSEWWWSYRPSLLLDDQMITHMTSAYKNIFHFLLTCEQSSLVTATPLMSDEARNQVLYTWNQSDMSFPEGKCMHHLFEEQAAKNPNSIALVWGGKTMTYGELNRRATCLAKRLQKLGVGLEVLVGLFIDQSQWIMIVGMLGIWKAGGAYVSLDPKLPVDRLQYMIENAQMPVVLTQSSVADQLPASQAYILKVDQEWEGIEKESQEEVLLSQEKHHPRQIAYVLYTSGSTGLPKGVVIEHRGLVSLVVTSTFGIFGMTPSDRTIQNTTFAFDMSLEEIWCTFYAGATLYLKPLDVVAGVELAAFLRNNRINNIMPTPSLLATIAGETLPDLKMIRVAGEACPVNVMKQFAGGRKFFNFYGPTECTVDCTYSLCLPNDNIVTIGKPLPNCKAYILDEELRPVPPGVPGELFIGGVGVGRGYLRREELTKEKFVPNPFGEGRMYRSGDVARFRADGTIDYMGRKDFQVKLRGLRIELGEIETVLSQALGVQNAAVLVREDEPGRQVLVGYVSPADVVSSRTLEYVASKLPKYMVPQILVVLAEFPLNNNGKTDRRLLPVPDYAQLAAGKSVVAPRNEFEVALVAIWSEVLGVPIHNLSTETSFFELGGHSLLATFVVSKVKAKLSVDISINTIFQHPTVASLATQVATLTPRQSFSPIPLVSRQPNKDGVVILPASSAQERMWFIYQVNSIKSLYNSEFSVRVQGKLDLENLIASIGTLTARHESLRTSLGADENGKTYQAIHPPDSPSVTVPIIKKDLSPLHPNARKVVLDELLTENVTKPFNLTEAPLMRCLVVRMEESGNEWVVGFALHHSITDGWSNNVILRELSEIYQGLPLSSLPLQYADYSEWSKGYLNSEQYQRDVHYWHSTIGEDPSYLELATDKTRTPAPNNHGNKFTFTLPADLTSSLRSVARTNSCTLFSVLLAAFQALLHRWTTQEDIIVGTAVANRSRAEVQEMVGMCINTLPLKSSLSPSLSFSTLLQNVAKSVMEAQDHQELPPDHMANVLKVKRHATRAAIFQVMLILQQQSATSFCGIPCEVLPEYLPTLYSRFDMLLEFTEVPAGMPLKAVLQYNSSIFHEATISRFANQLVQFLRCVSQTPSVSVGKVNLLCDEERNLVLSQWNSTDVSYPTEKCVHDLFMEQAKKTPKSIALVWGGEEMTYEELDKRSDSLAIYLHKLGVRPDSLVGLFIDQSKWMMIAGMLGIWKAGGAYVSLDPKLPSDRIEYMVDNARMPVVITQSNLVAQLPSLPNAVVVQLDTEWPTIAKNTGPHVRVPVSPSNLAYVLYTSGSTGMPKGVMVEHGGVVSLVTTVTHAIFGMTPQDRTIQNTTFAFDMSVEEIWCTFYAGATLYLKPLDVVAGAELAAFLRMNKITNIMPTPSLLATMAGEPLPDLKMIRVAGEACPVNVMKQFAGGRRFFNFYGPTECTVDCTYSLCLAEDDFVTIGKPLPNCKVYILDESLQPVPPGVPGELFIGGVGVGRGYLYKEELTREKFLPNPFSPGRMYRSGDVTKYRSDGSIEYMGRKDFQVKLRGLRIELGEIETILSQSKGVQNAAVLVREDEPGKQVLVGYVSPTGVNVEKTLAFVGTKVPKYMVPQILVVLESFPLNNNGKIERKKLPAPDYAHIASTAGITPLRNDVERSIAEIWSEVLGIPAESLGVESGFFELGGHSLLATRVVSIIRTKLNTKINVASMFTYPTIGALAEFVQNSKQTQVVHIPVATRTVRKNGDTVVAASAAQERLWFVYQLEENKALYNSTCAVRVSGLDTVKVQQALIELVARHESLRTNIESVEGKPVQVIHPGYKTQIPFEVVDLSGKGEEAAFKLFREESRKSFELHEGSLVRCVVAKVGASDFIVGFYLHHIITDGLSHEIFVDELSKIYHGTALPDLPIQYADFSVWQKEQHTTAEYKSHLAYWLGNLAGELPSLDMPTDRPRPPTPSRRGGVVRFSISPQLSEALSELARSHHCTMFMVLLASYQCLLRKYTGQEDIIVGTAIANRGVAATQQLIGFFVNTIAVRAVVAEDAPFTKLLETVRVASVAGFEHQDVPFDEVVTQLGVHRTLSMHPIYQAFFVLQGLSGTTEFCGSPASPVVISSDSEARFDLTLEVSEKRGGGYACSLEFAHDLFDASTVQRMSQHLVILMQSIVKAPASPISALEMMDEVEREKILYKWNETTKSNSSDLLVYQLFAEQAVKTPDNVALVWKTELGQATMTYCELNRRGEALADYLRKLGVSAEVVVGLCVDQAKWMMVVGMLGIWKAGGAYVSLDPKLPAERLRYMIDNANATVVLTQSDLLDKVPDGLSAKVTSLDTEWASIDRTAIEVLRPRNNSEVLSRGNPLVSSASLRSYSSPPATPSSTRCLSAPFSSLPLPSHLAYILYTSGSTGMPKGVAIEHGSLSNLIWCMSREFGLTEGDRTFQNPSYAFDISLMDIWITLTSGATLHLKPPGLIGGAELATFLRENHINFFLITPSVLSTLSGEPLPDLKVINVGGEPCPVALMQEFSASSKFIVGYGPTECTVACTAKTSLSTDDHINLGRPLDNYLIYILDSNLKPVPIGIPGELCIGGVGVGRGYINNETLTNSKFLPNPYASGRIYKTGDIARFIENGEIEFIGRKDFQVKLRGLRIELEEIEAVIALAPGVRTNAVLVRHDAPNPQILVGYVSPAGLDTATIQQFAGARLPAYMVPQVWVSMDSLPLNINGKIDRKALPMPDYSTGRDTVLPRNEYEQLIAEIWAEILGLPLDKVGVTASFFALGGHSLLATQVVARVNMRLKVNLNVRSMFEHPSIAEFAVHAKAAPPAHSVESTDDELIPTVPRNQVSGVTLMPTSFAQERMWVTVQLNTAQNLYNSSFIAKTMIAPDLNKLSEALQAVVKRHEVLRTSIVNIDGKPTQVIHPSVNVTFSETQLQSSVESEALACLYKDSKIPFDLMNDVPIRCHVVTLTSGVCYVLFLMHHIVTDGWSLAVFLKELNELYLERPLPPLSIQYADFAVWHRNLVSGKTYEEHKRYWTQKLGGELPTLDLPLDLPRPKVMSHAGGFTSVRIDASLTTSIRDLALTYQCTPYVVLLASFQTLLHRYTNLEDIIVGTTLANRGNKQLEQLIGFFVNTVAMRTDFSGTPTFAEILRRARTTALEAYEHQDMPFDEVVNSLHIPRNAGISPIFQVMLTYQRDTVSHKQLCGQDFTVIEEAMTMSKFDMTLAVEDGDKDMLISLTYATDLFNSTSAQRMLKHFECLLRSACAEPELHITQLDMMENGEKTKILKEWNNTDAPFPSNKCVHQLFVEQAQQHPNKTALVWDGGNASLTFSELDQRSDMLAEYLGALGVGPDVLVGLCVEQSQWTMIVGMLGIWKAGGAYVSLDPKLPPERLRYMMDTANMPVVLTQHNLIPKLPPNQPARVVAFDAVWDEVVKTSSGRKTHSRDLDSPNNLAYVLFTSGSTGLPKGVMIEHRGLTNLVTAMAPVLCMDDSGRTLQNPAYTFDMSLKDIWITLLVGAELHLKPADVIAGHDLAHYLREKRITYLFGTPTVLSTLVGEPLPDLKMINAAGEACSTALMQQLTPEGRRFIVTYGPTECSVSTTANVCCTGKPGAKLITHPVATIIGRPLANYQVYILDKEMRPVPTGTPGEIVIGGTGIARGYLNNAELTASKFVSNPFGSGKLYMSGDTGRFKEDGTIEFIGRKDFQVKLRGLRIELGEIEAILALYPGVQSTAALVREDEPGRPLLVAYVAPSDISVPALLAHAASRLPQYMVPYVVVCMDALPVNNNGKIERKALPPPKAALEDSLEPPHSVTEISIAGMWSRVLGIEYNKIGIDSNFFELGGTSLLIVSLVTIIRKELDPTFSVLDAFQKPTIREMAVMVTEPSTANVNATTLEELIELETKILVSGMQAPSIVDTNNKLALLSLPGFSKLNRRRSSSVVEGNRRRSNSQNRSPSKNSSLTPGQNSPSTTAPPSPYGTPKVNPFRRPSLPYQENISKPNMQSSSSSPSASTASRYGRRRLSVTIPTPPASPLAGRAPSWRFQSGNIPTTPTLMADEKRELALEVPITPISEIEESVLFDVPSSASGIFQVVSSSSLDGANESHVGANADVEVDAEVDADDDDDLYDLLPYNPLTVLLRQSVAVVLLSVAIAASFLGGIFFSFFIAGQMEINLIYTAPLIYFVFGFLTLLSLFAFKWTLLQRQHVRSYRLWSWQFLPWWIVHHLHQFAARQFLVYFNGTPLLTWYYRRLGATIGKGVCLDTELLSNPDLITIGDYSCIGRQAHLRTHMHKDGMMILEHIVVGDKCTVGDMSVLQPATRMENGSVLAPFSLLTENRFLPRQTFWEGSPAKYIHDVPLQQQHNSSNVLGVLFTVFGLLWLFASHIVGLVPFLYLVSHFISVYGIYIGSCFTPVGLALSLFLQGSFLVISKWLVIGKLKEGTYPLFGSYYYRRWLANQLIVLEPIYGYLTGTQYASYWLRLWGAKLGSKVEVATAMILDRDMLDIGDGVFLAENVMEAGATVQCGELRVRKVTVGSGSFVGNTTYLSGGAKVGKKCTIGALSCIPAGLDYPEGTTWVGSPPIQIPDNGDVLEQRATGKVSIWKRVIVDLFGLPYILVVSSICQLPFVLVVADLRNHMSYLDLRITAPYIVALSFVFVYLLTLVVKLFTGKQTPNTAYHNLSMYVRVRRNLFKPSRYLAHIGPLIQGTFLINWYYRLLGAKIGSRVYIDTMGLADWDLLDIGDDVVVSYNTHMQGHTAENNVFKFRAVKIGNGCNIGVSSVILPGVVVEDGVSLAPLTLAMKGETLAPFESVYGESVWEGTPARVCQDPPFILKSSSSKKLL